MCLVVYAMVFVVMMLMVVVQLVEVVYNSDGFGVLGWFLPSICFLGALEGAHAIFYFCGVCVMLKRYSYFLFLF